LMMIGYAYLGYMGLGDYLQARAYLEAALEIAQRADLQWHIPPTLFGLALVRGHLGDYGGAVNELQQWIRSLERSKLPRYLLMAYEMLASLLLEVDLNEQALDISESGRALADSTGITFWRGRREGTHAIARIRIGDLEVGPRLTDTLSWARENDERVQMVRCLEGLAELALRRGEIEACGAFAEEILTLADAAGMKELAARGRLWRGEALAASGKRDAAIEQLELAAMGAEKIGRTRHASDATSALAKLSGEPAHCARAAALAERIAASARECERLITTK
jgi:tetratricopeptide (TPR) repeat protein